MSDGDYARPNATVDVIIFALRDDELHVLLARRAEAPFAASWALPGGFIHCDEDEDVEAAARRVLLGKTGVASPYLEQVGTTGDARRDPRGWSLSVAYMALVAAECLSEPTRGEAGWHQVEGGGVAVPLAFDHAAILAGAVHRLRAKVEYTNLPVHLLPERFTLPDLQRIYECILGRRMDKSAFRKRVTEADFLEPVAGEKRAASNRPAQIYRVKPGAATTFFDRTI